VKDTSNSTEIANDKALEFLTGYLIEKSLAVDNIFVFLMIFTYFAIPSHFQKRVLMIGIVGAIVLRTVMILVGGWLLSQFHWILYVFGAFLILTGIKMWWAAGKEPSLEDNPALKLLNKLIPVSKSFDGEKFWTVENGKKIATPLFMVICLIAITDIIFAVDSIPAIFAITDDAFIVLTSNVFAILGLRAMYFLLANVASKFHLLNYGLAVILMFIGTKMCLIDVYKVPVAASLAVVVGILVTNFHRAWPWSERRWRFVASRMAELAPLRWQADAAALASALQGAAQVRSVDDPHLAPWLARMAVCEAGVELFPKVTRRCDSFSQWWTRTSRGLATASDLLAAQQAPAC
jgi:tellurite resistance protein TerC